MLGELDENRMKGILASQSLGRLACCNAGKPYIIPVTYAFDGDYIYGQTNEGLKLDIMRKNPRVCFEVDQMLDMRNWQSVIVNGKFQELNSEDAELAREQGRDRRFKQGEAGHVSHPHRINDRQVRAPVII